MRRENQQVKKGKEVKKISEMTKGQIKYETKRAVKNGMTLEEWIEFKNTVPEVTLYHYTNGVKLPHILKDGFLNLCTISAAYVFGDTAKTLITNNITSTDTSNLSFIFSITSFSLFFIFLIF